MRSHELAKLIMSLPDAEVILQKDAEGNGYSPLEGADQDSIYIADSTYSGDVYSTKHNADDHCLSIGEWTDMQAANPRALVLYPVN